MEVPEPFPVVFEFYLPNNDRRFKTQNARLLGFGGNAVTLLVPKSCFEEYLTELGQQLQSEQAKLAVAEGKLSSLQTTYKRQIDDRSGIYSGFWISSQGKQVKKERDQLEIAVWNAKKAVSDIQKKQQEFKKMDDLVFRVMFNEISAGGTGSQVPASSAVPFPSSFQPGSRLSTTREDNTAKLQRKVLEATKDGHMPILALPILDTVLTVNNKTFLNSTVMGYSPFGDLDFVLGGYLNEPNKERSLDVIYKVVWETIELLSEMHSKLGFIHGDIKPANILVNMDFSLKLADFDWSLQAGANKKFGGSKFYKYPYGISPQSKDDPRDITYHMDCFPVGAMILYLLAGKHTDVLFVEGNEEVKQIHFNHFGRRVERGYGALKPQLFTYAFRDFMPHLESGLQISKKSCPPDFLPKLDNLVNLAIYLTMPKVLYAAKMEESHFDSQLYIWRYYDRNSNTFTLTDPLQEVASQHWAKYYPTMRSDEKLH